MAGTYASLLNLGKLRRPAPQAPVETACARSFPDDAHFALRRPVAPTRPQQNQRNPSGVAPTPAPCD